MKLLAFGNPDLVNQQLDLPYAQLEVEGIKKIVPGTDLYLRAEATKNKAREMLSNYDIAHFATRGIFSKDEPLNSVCCLRQTRRRWQVNRRQRYLNSNLKGRAIVLSGCKTAMGHSASGWKQKD